MKTFALFSRLATLMFAASALTAVAQPTQVKVKAYEFSKFLEITKDDVNLRRQPSTTSGKLMEWSSDGGSYFTETYYYYTDYNPKRYRANDSNGSMVNKARVYKGWTYAVFDERNGWYQLQVNNRYDEAKPWVLGSFGKLYTLRKAAELVPVPNQSSFDEHGNSHSPSFVQTVARKNGKYKGLKFGADYRASDGMLIVSFPFHVADYGYTVLATVGLRVDYAGGSKPQLNVTKEYGMDDEEYEVVTFKIGKVPPVVATRLLQNWLLTCSDTDFEKVLRNISTNDDGYLNATVIYVDTEGEYHQMDVYAETVSSLPSKQYTFKLTAQ